MALITYGASTTPLIDPNSFPWPLTLQKQHVDKPALNAELSLQAPILQKHIVNTLLVFSADNTVLATGNINIYNLALH